jgi:hypothetical protein
MVNEEGKEKKERIWTFTIRKQKSPLLNIFRYYSDYISKCTSLYNNVTIMKRYLRKCGKLNEL